MSYLYYINGKRVNAETYWRTVDIQTDQELLHKSCIEYYKANPDKFEILFKFSDEKMLYWNMIMEYAKTDDWKRTKALYDYICFLASHFVNIRSGIASIEWS